MTLTLIPGGPSQYGAVHCTEYQSEVLKTLSTSVHAAVEMSTKTSDAVWVNLL